MTHKLTLTALPATALADPIPMAKDHRIQRWSWYAACPQQSHSPPPGDECADARRSRV